MRTIIFTKSVILNLLHGRQVTFAAGTQQWANEDAEFFPAGKLHWWLAANGAKEAV